MILIFVASLNENMKLAKNLQEQLKSEKLESEIINLVELNLPMYDTLKEQNDGIPTKIHELSEKMNKAEGFFIYFT